MKALIALLKQYGPTILPLLLELLAEKPAESARGIAGDDLNDCVAECVAQGADESEARDQCSRVAAMLP